MIKMNEEIKITNEDIELLKEIKENCLKADVYDDEKRLLKSNTITKFLNLYNNWNELKKWLEFMIMQQREGKTVYISLNDILSKMQELEQGKDENN